jgi:hypothetical protein
MENKNYGKLYFICMKANKDGQKTTSNLQYRSKGLLTPKDIDTIRDLFCKENAHIMKFERTEVIITLIQELSP